MVGIPRASEANAPESAAGGEMSFQYRGYRRAQHEVGVGNDAGGDHRRAVLPDGALGGDSLDELRLANRTQLLRSPRPVHGTAFDEHRLLNLVAPVVASAQVLSKLVQEIPVAGPVPEVMVGVTDGQSGLQRVFWVLRKPGITLAGHVHSS